MRATAIVFVGNNTYEHVGRASTLDAPVVDDAVVVRARERRTRNSTNGLFWTVQAIAPLPKSRSRVSSSCFQSTLAWHVKQTMNEPRASFCR